jgi:Icc protein
MSIKILLISGKVSSFFYAITCVQFKPFSDDFALDENAPGYRYIRLKMMELLKQKCFVLKISKINTEISGY